MIKKKPKIAPEIAPPEKQIIFCISLYFSIPKKFNRSISLFKIYLNEIAEKRSYLDKIKDATQKSIFKIYLTSKKTKREISVSETNKSTSGVYLINRNLQNLVNEIMQDFESGLLKVQPIKKKPTKRDMIRKLNEDLQKIGYDIKIPLRKPSQREYLSDWRKFSTKIDAET